MNAHPAANILAMPWVMGQWHNPTQPKPSFCQLKPT